MAMAAHLAELAEKHRLLDQRIEEAIARPGTDDAEIRRFIAAHVAGEIDSPASQKAKVIDVAESIDGAWSV